MSCINQSHPNFKAIVNEVGDKVTADYLTTVWQKQNSVGIETIPNVNVFRTWLKNSNIILPKNNDYSKQVAEFNKQNNKYQNNGSIKEILEKQQSRFPLLNLKGKITPNNEIEVYISLQKSTETTGNKDEQLDNKIKRILTKLGITITSKDFIYDKYGITDNTAKAEFDRKNLKGIIEVVEGKAGIDTLTEEATHFLVWMLRGSKLYKSMMNDITKFPEYQEVLAEYGNDKNYNDLTLKEEAITKLITKRIISLYNNPDIKKHLDTIEYLGTDSLNLRAKQWFKKVIDWLKEKLLGLKQDSFDEAALKFLMEDYSRKDLENIGKNIENVKIKQGVEELFESNQDLANTVYEALGFEKNISLNDAVGKTFTIDIPIEVLPDELQNQFKNFDIGDNFTIGYDGEKFNIYKFNSDTEINKKALSPDRFELNALDIHNNATKDVKRIREIEYIQYAFPKYQDKNISITTKEAGYIQWYLKDGFYYAELERREFYKIPAKKIQDLQAKLNTPFEVEVKEKLIKIKSLEDVSSNTMKNLLQISSAKENINNFNLTSQQKQQATSLFSEFLDVYLQDYEQVEKILKEENIIQKKCS